MATYELKNPKRIVIKLGTSTLTHRTGRLNIRRVDSLVKVISDLYNAGNEIIIVSSGAIGLGVAKMNLPARPTDTPSKQACAAVGQCELMYMYDQKFAKYGITVAQLLLTKFVLLEGRRHNVVNTLNRLIEQRIIPIINENDTVAIDELELEMGENDSLSAIVSSLIDADWLVILSDIDGLYDKNPNFHDDAKIISRVDVIDDSIRALAGGAGSALGTGGMITKIKAAEIATAAGCDMIILNSQDPENLYQLIEGRTIGTLFKAAPKKKNITEEDLK